MSSSYRMELDKWLSQLDVKADRVLDIGGAQLPLPKRVKSWDVGQYIIADLAKPHADSPKPDVELDLNLGIHRERWRADYWGFDLIFCLEVFDYIYDPITAFLTIKNLLSENGSAWVSFPSFYPHHNPIKEDALRYMEGGIRKLAEASGLTIKQMIKRQPETDLINRLWITERMRAAKHYDHLVTGFIVEFTR